MGRGIGLFLWVRVRILWSPFFSSYLSPINQPRSASHTCMWRNAPPFCRLQEIQTVAGRAAPRPEVLDALVAGDFDPEEYDRQMAAAFGDDYYGAVRQ